jgi:hypothetical protein
MTSGTAEAGNSGGKRRPHEESRSGCGERDGAPAQGQNQSWHTNDKPAVAKLTSAAECSAVLCTG